MNVPATQTVQPLQGRSVYRLSERFGFLIFGSMLGLLLTVASLLKPDPSGLGTHRQLGLPGCTMYTLLGIRCPGCGMTTSWAHTMNGDLASAIRANLGGVLFCLISVFATPILFWLAIRGRPISTPWFTPIVIVTLIVAVSISFAEWLIRMAFQESF